MHADTDAEEWSRLVSHRFRHRLNHAVKRVQATAAIGEGANARQHNAIGTKHHFRVAGHHDPGRVFHAPRGALKRFRGGVQVAGAVVDDRNAQRDAPGSGKRPMMSSRGSGGGRENDWPGISRVGGGAPRSTAG